VSSATPIEDLLTGMLSSVGNAALKLDPTSSVRLRALEGKSLRLEIIPPGSDAPRPLTLISRDAELEWEATRTDQPNVILTGTLPDILALLANPEAANSVRIEGDEVVLADFGAVLSHFEPDLAGPMTDVIGPQLADNLIGLAEAGIAVLKSAAESIGQTAREGARANYLADAEFSTMLDRLDSVRLRIDRLSARVGLLESSRTG